MNKQTNEEMEKQTNGHTKTHRQMEKWKRTKRQMDAQTNGQMNKWVKGPTTLL